MLSSTVCQSVCSPLPVSSHAPWNDVVRIEQHHHFAGPLHEHSSQGYVIGLHLRKPARIETKISGDRSRCEVFSPGESCFINPGIVEVVRMANEGETLVATIDSQFLRTVAAESAGIDRVEICSSRPVRDSQIEHFLLALQAELNENCVGGRLHGELLATLIVLRLVKLYSGVSPAIREYNDGLPVASLRRIKDYIHAHLSEGIRLIDLARQAHMSPYHFARLFKQSTGLPPHQYVLMLRIESAKKSLREKRLPMADIALSVGFQSQSNFSVTFHRIAGITPGAYRKQE